MSLVNQVTFSEFASAAAFSRWIGGGVVRPNQGSVGFFWESESTQLDFLQRACYDAYKGINSVWHDDESGLTWQFSSAYVEFFTKSFYGKPFPALLAPSYSDWRVPTLTELKTLRSNVQDENGLWRTTALAGKAGPVLRSSTKGYFDPDERMDWDFAQDSPCEDVHTESKIAWGAEGQFAGFEGGSSEYTGATYVLVRGTYSAKLPEWLRAQVQWAEKYRMDTFPVTEKTIEMLTALPIKGNHFPPYLDQLTGLRTLNATNSDSLDPNVFALPAIESLTWDIGMHAPAAKQTAFLPSGVGNLKQLKKLLIHGPIKLVPSSICDLNNLEELDLAWAVDALPESLGHLAKLRTLKIHSGNMKSLPKSIGQLSALVELSVHAQDLRRVPDELHLLQSLVRLDMRGCSLQQLPAQLKDLRLLNVLSLERNHLAEVPEVVWELSQLERLDLSFNPFTTLPSKLAALTNLKWLNLCGVPIGEVPLAVQELHNLESLILSGTQIQELPQWLWEMKSLRYLSIARTWKLPRVRHKENARIKIDTYSATLDLSWGREWLRMMGKPD